MARHTSRFGSVLAAALLSLALGAVVLGGGTAFAQKKDAPAAAKRETAKPATKKDEPQISAPYAILVDADNGAVLFERDADTLVYPASLAKLMTAEFVFNEIKQGRIKLTDEFQVSENAWRRGGAPSGGSTMFAALNSRIAVSDLIRGMIIQSGNDACIVLAEALAGNEPEFAARLTKRAREIGLAKSTFTNSNGLPDPGMQVTARELSILARHIIRTYPEFYQIYGETDFLWNKIRQSNRNPLLSMGIGADGMKTGFTKEAGYGLVGSAMQNGLRLIVVVNGLKTAKERADEARKLLDWGFRSFEQRILFGQGQALGTAKVFGGAAGSVPLVADGEVKVMLPKAGSERLIARIVYTGPVPAPVEQGHRIGTLKVWRGENVILEVPLKAGESIDRGNISQRAVDAVTEMMIGLFRAGAQRL